MPTEAPLPPRHLARRVEAVDYSDDPLAHYELLGEEAREQIVSMLPGDWSFEGKRVLDFGCGSGRVLRQFLDEARTAEFWGCDIDEASVAWLKENLCPPLHAFTNGAEPPVEQADGTFDLIYALSVFTHLTNNWSRWLLELHRLLRGDGLLIATYMGKAVSEWIADEPWSEDRVGMNVLKEWQSWDLGGPAVFVSEWWMRAHWGRAFEVVEVVDQPHLAGTLGLQSWALLRKKPVELTPEDLERAEPGEEREMKALRHNIRQLHAEAARERAVLEGEAQGARKQLSETVAQLEQMKAGYESSLGWRLTNPLRRVKRRMRRGTGASPG